MRSDSTPLVYGLTMCSSSCDCGAYWCDLPSLADQTFTVRTEREKERLVTIDRFPWHRGIQKRDVISNVTRKEVSALPFCDVGNQQ